MCDTNKLHELNVSTDSCNTKNEQTAAAKIHSFPNETTPKSFKYDNDEQVPIPTKISWTKSPPPPQPIRPIISNTFTASYTSSSSYNPSYSQSLDVDDEDHSGSDLDSSEQTIPITVQRLNTLFCDKLIDPDHDVSNTAPANDSQSQSANHNDYNMKLLNLKSIGEEDSDWDDVAIDIPKFDEKKELKAAKDEDIERTADETNDANEDQKDGDLEADEEEIPVIEQGPALSKLYEQAPMLYIRDNIVGRVKEKISSKRKKAISQKKVDSKLSANAIPWPGLPQSSFLEQREIYQKFKQILEESGIDLLKENDKSIKKKNGRKRKQVMNYLFVPNGPKSEYYIPRQFTQKLSALIKENINIDKRSVYEFMIKMLRVINFEPNPNDTVKVFDFGLDGIYFRAKRQSPTSAKSKNKWKIDEVIAAHEVKQDNIEVLKPPMIVNDTQMCYVEQVFQNKEKLLAIINRTKWTKIPIYKKKIGGKHKQLQYPKKDFIANCVQLVEDMDLRLIQLIPIVMFDHRDKYWVEYVWILRIDSNADIAISFAYKCNGKRKSSVGVAGIYLDKNQILKQHHIISTSSTPETLTNFRTDIDSLYIGDAQDDENRIKDLYKRLDDAKDENERQMHALAAIERMFNYYQ